MWVGSRDSASEERGADGFRDSATGSALPFAKWAVPEPLTPVVQLPGLGSVDVLRGLDRASRDVAERVLYEAEKGTEALEADRRPPRERAIAILRAKVRGVKPPRRQTGSRAATADGSVFVADLV